MIQNGPEVSYNKKKFIVNFKFNFDNLPKQWKNNAIEVIENLRDDEKFWESYKVVIVKYL